MLALGLAASEYPHAVLTGADGLEASVYLPDAETGFYRGSRFCWAGMVSEIRWQGHTVFAPWRTPHNPTHPEHGIGTAAEFGLRAAVGFAEAKPGGTALKVGVGLITKPDDKDYKFNNSYALAKVPVWVNEASDTAVVSTQTLKAGGYAYTYVVSVTVAADSPAVVISHALTNNGKAALVTDHYAHNFISIDGHPVGPGLAVALPFDPTPREDRVKNFAGATTLVDQRIAFPAPLKRTLWTPFPKAQAGDNAFTVEAPGVALVYSGTGAVDRFEFYATGKVVCPEPYVAIQVEPGATQRWELRYQLQKR
ncbi:MAG: hypothetical protein PF961_04485 [Planctomycetota bacterium]|nr:hypothetical protein [Planctomycetota bacterium]